DPPVTRPVKALAEERTKAVAEERTKPAAEERRKPTEGSAPSDLAGLDVLLVEDDEGTRDAVALLLRTAGAQVRTAASVEEGIRSLGTWRPGVVVSDIGLPREDGYALIRRLRAIGGQGERIPAVAMTAYAHADERRRVLAEGFDAHLAKPVDSAILIR